MNILVTGATGFIGRAFCREAIHRGHRVLALCRSLPQPPIPGVEIAIGTLSDTPWKMVEKFSPDSALHLAWLVTPGICLNSPTNQEWLFQSKNWFERLLQIGVPYISGAGTCLEYATSNMPLNEEKSPLGPMCAYSEAKVALFEWLRNHATDSKSKWAWFRIFYAYGRGEHANRLCSSVIKTTKNGEPFSTITPNSVRDYIHIDDVAAALCMALETNTTGPINIGTGKGIAIAELVKCILSLCGKSTSKLRTSQSSAPDCKPVLVADNTKISGTSWAPKKSIEDGLKSLIFAVGDDL